MELRTEEFRLFSDLIYDKFGVNLSDQKRTLLVERLQKTIREGNFHSFREYYNYVIDDRSGQELLHLIDRISTNHTNFFRENEHFEYLRDELLPKLVSQQRDEGGRKIRIWSAGCSSGEEPYTMAIVLNEYFGAEIDRWDIGILATDISTTVLQKAVIGVYSKANLAGVPPLWKQKYFEPIGGDNWQVKDKLKRLVTFRRLNLMNDSYPFKGKFQIIFCRNVMIYFDEATRLDLIGKYSRYTEEKGYLFIGHSETLTRSNDFYSYLKPAIYQKKSGV